MLQEVNSGCHKNNVLEFGLRLQVLKNTVNVIRNFWFNISSGDFLSLASSPRFFFYFWSFVSIPSFDLSL